MNTYWSKHNACWKPEKKIKEYGKIELAIVHLYFYSSLIAWLPTSILAFLQTHLYTEYTFKNINLITPYLHLKYPIVSYDSLAKPNI